MAGDDITDKLTVALGLDDDVEVNGEAETEFEVSYADSVIVRAGDEPNTVIVGYLSPDNDPQSFFDDDGIGELKEFRSETERDDFVKEVKRGRKIALIVDKYAHGNVHYSVQNTAGYPDRRWDVAPCGVFVPCDDVQKTYRSAMRKASKAIDTEARSQAQVAAWNDLVRDTNAILDSYSKWCNGEVFGVVTETWAWESDSKSFEMTSNDACWGFIGSEQAKSELESLIGSPAAEEPKSASIQI